MRDNSKVNAWRREWRRKNLEKTRERGRADSRLYRERNGEVKRQRNMEWAKANTERVAAYMKEYEAKRKAEGGNQLLEERAAYKAPFNAERRARRLQATPPWLTLIQRSDMAVFYVLARRITKETGIQHHVDHIHPLRGKKSWGLHVPWNLQILTATENMRKGNR